MSDSRERAAGRRLRLRRRRPHRPARVPRVAARTRTSSTSATQRAFPTATARRGAARLRARAGGHPARARRQAARGGLQLGHRGGAARAARASSPARCRWWASSRPSRGSPPRPRATAAWACIATPATVASGAYDARSGGGRARAPSCTRWPAPELAPLIQAGGEVDERTVACVERACEPLREAGVDTVILGCTHYPLVRPVLQRALGPRRAIVTLGRGDRQRGRARAAARPAWRARRGPPRRVPLPRLGRPRGVPAPRHPLPAAADRRVGHVRGRAATAERRRERRTRRRPRARTSCARSRSSRASCAPPPARR